MERLIRKSTAHSGLQLRALLQALFAAELVQPSRTLWLVSPWIKDVPVIDNRSGAFRAGTTLPSSEVALSTVLAAIAARGGNIVVVTTSDPMNAHFRSRLEDEAIRAGVQDRIRLHLDDEDRLHEKGLLGDGFYLYGSMNFTFHGLLHGRETISLTTNQKRIAAVRTGMRDDYAPRAGQK